MKRFQVTVWTPRGSFRMMTSAKSAKAALNNCRFRLRERGVFTITDSEVLEV